MITPIPLPQLGACCLCQTGSGVYTLHFEKVWNGFAPFNLQPDFVLTAMYRTFSFEMHATDLFDFTGSVTLDRLTGHPALSASFTPLAGGVVNDWADFRAQRLVEYPLAALPNSLSADFGSVPGSFDSYTWSLRDPYTITELESDVDAMVAAVDELAPELVDVNGAALDVTGKTVRVRRREWMYDICFPEMSPDCRHPQFYDAFGPGGFAYFPWNEANYNLPRDSVAGGLIGEVLDEFTGPASANSFNTSNTLSQFNGSWTKTRSLFIPSSSQLCQTETIYGTNEPQLIQTACAMVQPDGFGRLLMRPPATRRVDNLVIGGFNSTTRGVEENKVLTNGGCPCRPEV